MKFSIIISNTSRSLSYLKGLKKNNLTPNEIFHIDNGSNVKISKQLKKVGLTFNKVKMRCFKLPSLKKRVAKNILKSKTKNIIYSGYPGEIIKDQILLKNKNIIHSHPGKLPMFKGSTTIYYSLLKSGKIFCSTIILGKNLDSGRLLFLKKYKLPKNIKLIDESYDNYIRTNNIIYVIKNFNKIRPKKQKSNKFSPYYVAHPILRSIVFNNF